MALQVAHCWRLGLEAVVVLEQYQVCFNDMCITIWLSDTLQCSWHALPFASSFTSITVPSGPCNDAALPNTGSASWQRLRPTHLCSFGL